MKVLQSKTFSGRDAEAEANKFANDALDSKVPYRVIDIRLIYLGAEYFPYYQVLYELL